MDIAVQLGTDNTIVYKKNVGIILNEATCIAYSTDTKGNIKIIECGNNAKKMSDRAPDGITVDFPVACGRIINPQIAGIFFREVIKTLGGGGQKFSALFIIPCSLTPEELDAYRTVAFGAGLKDAAFIPAVITNALELGHSIDGGPAALSVNIGEGGTDIAVLSYCGIIKGGTIDQGGAMITDQLRQGIKRIFQLQISLRMAELARAETATLLPNDETQFRITGTDMLSGVTREAYLRGRDTYHIIMPIYDKIARTMTQVINQTNPEVTADIRRGGIYVGGSLSRVTGLREYLTNHLGMPVNLGRDSVNSAILGAGKLLSNPILLQKIIKAN